jgi:tRNA G18 (ribose-2'-O)-methylase SpoU
MARIIEVTDLNDPGLEAYARLTEAQLRSRLEPEKGVFIAESPKVIRLALEAGCEPLSLLMERRQLTLQGAELMERCGEIPVYTGEREVLAALTGYALTRGILCAMRRPPAKKPGEILSSARRVAVPEDVVDAANLGAIFRCAAALGVDGVLLTPGCCDPLLRRVVRVSMGTVFQVPWARLGEDSGEWPEKGLGILHSHGFRTAAMALREDSISVDDPRLLRLKKMAILLGTEGDGLTPAAIEGCDYIVRIPMSHGVDSLNVAAAAAVAFWELRVRG